MAEIRNEQKPGSEPGAPQQDEQHEWLVTEDGEVLAPAKASAGGRVIFEEPPLG